MTIAFVILGVTIALFVFTRLRPDFVALIWGLPWRRPAESSLWRML